MPDEDPVVEPEEEKPKPKAKDAPKKSIAAPAHKRKAPGKPVLRPRHQDVLASLDMLREAESCIERVSDLGAVKIAGNLLGTIRTARKRAEEALPLQKGGNLQNG